LPEDDAIDHLILRVPVMAFNDEKVNDITQYAASSDEEDVQKEWTREEERAAKWKSVIWYHVIKTKTY
jgi:hypothetical protein